MNKLSLFLAFASFALVACSDDSSEYHAGCSKSTKDCLVGMWQLQRIEKANGNKDPDCSVNSEVPRENTSDKLTLEKNGDFLFAGGALDIDIAGDWSLNEDGTLKIECLPKANCPNSPSFPIPDVINATIEVTTAELKVTTPGYTAFSRCRRESSERLTEVFSWVGPSKK